MTTSICALPTSWSAMKGCMHAMLALGEPEATTTPAEPPAATQPASAPSTDTPSADTPATAPAVAATAEADPPTAVAQPAPTVGITIVEQPHRKPHAPLGTEDPRLETDEDPREADDYRWSRSERPNIVGQPVSKEWDAELIINTDRPDFTDVLPTVLKHVWQTESGYSYKIRRYDGSGHDRHQVPETLIRLGLTDRLELRLRWDAYAYTRRTGEAATSSSSSGPQWGSDFLVGFKWQAVKQKHWRPAHTLMGTFVYRMGTGGLANTAVQPGFNWIYGWQVNKWLVIRGSTGVEIIVREPQRDEGVVEPEPSAPKTLLDLHQSAVAYWQIAKHLGAYTEWFGFFDFGAERAFQHNLGAGLYIYVTPNVQLDVRGGGSVAGEPREIFTGGGLSLRGDYLAGRVQRKRQRRARV
ncbi:MAG: transporter [Nannocystaceae bacterium]